MAIEQDHTERDPDFCKPVLWRILGIQCMDKVNNKDLWERTNQVQIEIEMPKRRWGWLGQTLRKPNSNITRQAKEGETEKHLAT